MVSLPSDKRIGSRQMKAWIILTLAAGLSAGSAAADTVRPDCEDFHNNHRLDSHDRQWCQALAIKDNYLRRGFVESVPGSKGRATGVSSRLTTLFSSGGETSIHGTVKIDTLSGRFRLKLASTDNVLYYSRKVQIQGTAGLAGGVLELYSYVDVDLWKLSAVLVDRPVRGQEPPEEGLVLKGYQRTVVKPDEDAEFTANLIPLAGDYYLLLAAPDGPARDITLEISNK